MHRMNQTNFIGTQESVYRDSPTGKLETISLVGTMLPLQQGFDSNSQARLPIGVDNLFTFIALEQRIVGTVMSILRNSTAVRTPFGCVPTIYHVQRNITVKASLFEDTLELSERNTHGNSVELLTLRLESSKVLNRNISVKPFGYVYYLFSHLPKISLDEISFFGSQLCQLLENSDRLELRTASHYLLSSCPDVLSKISLVKNLAIRRSNRDGKMLCIDVNPEGVLLCWNNTIFFGKIGGNLLIGCQTECFASPSVLNQRIESLKIPILFDRNCDSISWISSQFNKESTFSFECFAITRNIELDSQILHSLAFLSPNISNERADNLNIKGGVFFAS